MADQNLTAVLGVTTSAVVTMPAEVAALVSTIPRRGTDPAAVRDWWDKLSMLQQQQLVQWAPEKIGYLDGIPAIARHRANLVNLEAMLDDLQDRKASLEHPTPLSAISPATQLLEIVQIDRKIAALNDLKSRLYGSWANGEQPLYLLGLRDHGDGRTVLSIGNPDDADHVSVYIPGTTAALNSGFEEDLYRAQAMHEYSVRAGGDSEKVASIIWLDYDAPDTAFPFYPFPEKPVPEALFDHYAEDGGPRLRNFLEGLNVTHEGPNPAHTTLVPHSYATQVVAEAARHEPGMHADIVAVGGAGYDIRGERNPAATLNIDGTVYNATSQKDIIRWAYEIPAPAPTGSFGPYVINQSIPVSWIHGYGPGYLPGVISVETSEDTGHTEYWRDEKFLGSLAKIIVGK